MLLYKLPIVFTAQTAQVDAAEIVAPATHSCRIHRIYLAQSTELADAQEEQLRLNLNFGATTSGSGGNSSVTAVPLFLGLTAFGGTCETHNTTKSSAGTIVTPEQYSWNVRMPFDIVYSPEARPRIAPSERFTLELATTPADSVTFGGFIAFEIC